MEKFELTDYLERIASALEEANQLAAARNAISREALDLQKDLLERERARSTYTMRAGNETIAHFDEKTVQWQTGEVGKEITRQIRQSGNVRQV